MTPSSTCPKCHRTYAAGVDFCPDDLYPLFFSRVVEGETAEAIGPAPKGRLPGVGGLHSATQTACHACQEPNPLDRIRCVRCGALLRGPGPFMPSPAPEPLVAPENAAPIRRVVPAEPEPAPPVPRSWWEQWWPAVVAAAFLVAVFLVMLLVT